MPMNINHLERDYRKISKSMEILSKHMNQKFNQFNFLKNRTPMVTLKLDPQFKLTLLKFKSIYQKKSRNPNSNRFLMIKTMMINQCLENLL